MAVVHERMYEVAMSRTVQSLVLLLLLLPATSRGLSEKKSLEPPRLVRGLTVGVNGNLWVADETPGGVWMSPDQGASWIRVPVFTAEGYQMTTPPASVVADSRHAGKLMVRAESICDAEGCEGGETFLTADSGKTWQEVEADERPDFEAGVGGLSQAKWQKCTFTASADGVRSKCEGGKGSILFPTAITRRGPASRLVDAAGKLSSVEVVESGTGKTVASFTAEQLVQVNKALGRGEPAGDWVATTPPWPNNVLVLTTKSGEKMAVRFVNLVLRISQVDSATGNKPASDDIWRANTQDFTLHEEDADWFWGVLGSYLGSTKVKEYMPIKEPMFDNPKSEIRNRYSSAETGFTWMDLTIGAQVSLLRKRETSTSSFLPPMSGRAVRSMGNMSGGKGPK